jgi:hypothetical protein
MASIRKSFNLRNGVQVDDDNFIVNSNGLVGIGTSVPTEILDVYGGNIRTNENVIANELTSFNLSVSGVTTENKLNIDSYINVGVTSITSGIITSYIGVVTYYGDGGSLLNLPTSQWLDVDVGLGFTSIYAQGFVGIATIDPRYVLQVGGNNNINAFTNGVGIDSEGNIRATGIITAFNFVGIGSLLTQIDADNVTLGKLNNSRLPENVSITGIITAGNYFSGSLVGVADTANDVTPSSSISVTGLKVTGVSTADNLLNVQGSVGIGTISTNADLHIRRSGISSLRLTSDGSFPSRIIIGRNAINTNSNAEIRFGNTDDAFQFSTENSLDIINYDSGNFNYYNNISGGSGNYYWFSNASIVRMVLTSTGNLGIGATLQPSRTLDVVGTSTVSSNSYVGADFFVVGNAFIGGSLNVGPINASGQTLIQNRIGVSTNNPSYTLQVGGNPLNANGGVGIGSDGFLRIRNDIATVRNVNATGIVTSTGLVVNGNANISGNLAVGSIDGNVTDITNIDADNITSGTLNTARLPNNITVSGNITGSGFIGNGSQITTLNATNISSGTLNTARLPNNITVSGTITGSGFIGNGSQITTLSASNVTSGTLNTARLPDNITIDGILTANSLSTNGNARIQISLNTDSNPGELTLTAYSGAVSFGSVTLQLS